MKKIMFNDRYGLTTAVLEGRKTMTRRVAEKVLVEDENGELRWNGEFKPARYKVGEVVAVAQAYGDIVTRMNAEDYQSSAFAPLLSQGPFLSDGAAGWTNKMFVRADLMPHHIRITGIQVERLRDIAEEDCLREGIYKRDPAPGVPALFAYDTTQDQDGHMLATTWYTTARGAFSGLIDKVSGKGTWGDNPWVFVYEFELVKED